MIPSRTLTEIPKEEILRSHWLRQVVLTYNLPRRWIDRTPLQNASLSFVGRNLAIIHSNVPNIDPESSYTSGNAQGLDFFRMPATRSFGFNLNVSSNKTGPVRHHISSEQFLTTPGKIH
jgi:hypothetical protein